MALRVLNSYMNGGASVTIYADGTKIRTHMFDSPPILPESIDVKITNWCDAACSWCHEKSTKRGNHADLQPLVDLLMQMPAGAELAIGGGHAMAHPEFDDFVKELSRNGLICNVTVNEFHFAKEKTRLERLVADNHIYGVGYSYSTIPCTWEYENLISHIIVGVTSPQEYENVISVNKKVLLLGYKNFGRGENYAAHFPEKVKSNIDYWYRYLFKAANLGQLSFDNLAIAQLNPKRLFSNANDYDTFYMGNDGSHTMYIDAVEQKYAATSTSKIRYSINRLSLKEIFSNVRSN